MGNKKKGKDPAFLFYPNDFIVGTLMMTDEEVGIYIRLLAYIHTRDGKITEQEFKRFNGDKYDIVKGKFKLDDDGMYYNKRLIEEIESRKHKSKVAKENGSKGGNPLLKEGKPNPYYQKDKQKDKQKDNLIYNQKISITLEDENEDVNINKDLNKNIFKDDLKEVIEYLNIKLNTKYRYNSNTSKEHIIPRFKEGFTVEDLKRVIDVKYDEWIGTDMAKHLNPTTLFRPSNFERYLNQDELEKNGVKIKPKHNGFKTQAQLRDERKAKQFEKLAKERGLID